MRGAAGYVVLVAAALLIESALLRAGAGLRTAPAIGGRWDLRAAGAKPVPVTIVQTGPYIDVTMSSAPRLRGTIEDRRISAAADGVTLAGSIKGRAIEGTIRCDGVRRLCRGFESAPPPYRKAAAEPPHSISFRAERVP